MVTEGLAARAADERELVSRAQAGDVDAFGALYERYFGPVYDFLVRLMRDPEEAADVTQDTFIRAMRAIRTLREGSSFRGWLFRIARNTALNRLAQRRRSETLDGDAERPAFAVVDERRLSDPETAAEAEEAAALVWEAAQALDPRQLSLLDLHLRQGLDTAEIAEVLGVTRNNAAVMLHRLRNAVRSAIETRILAERPACPRLAEALGPPPIALTPEVRRTVEKHVQGCPECDERRRRLVPLAVFAALAPVPAPAGLAERIWRTLADAAARGELGAEGGVGRTALGLTRATHRLFLVSGLAVVSVLLATLVLLPASPLSIFANGVFGDGEPDAAPEGPTSTPTAAAGVAAAPSPSPTATPSPTPTPPTPTVGTTPSAAMSPAPATTAPPLPSATPTATVPSPTPSATPIPTATPTATPTAAPTPTPCSPAPAVNVEALQLDPNAPVSSFFVFDSAGCGSFSVIAQVAGPGGQWLEVDPGEGTVGPAQPLEVTVRANLQALPGTGEGTFTATVRLEASAGSILRVTVTLHRVGSAPAVRSAALLCDPASGVAELAAVVEDDFGVVAAEARYGERVFTLTQVGGTWVAELPLDEVAEAIVAVVAVDGAGQESAPFSTQCQ